MDAREEPIDFRLRFQLSYDTGQRRAVMMDRGVFHTPLTVRIGEKLNHGIEWLIGVVDDIRKGYSLPIF
jgi:hypothetical protein